MGADTPPATREVRLPEARAFSAARSTLVWATTFVGKVNGVSLDMLNRFEILGRSFGVDSGRLTHPAGTKIPNAWMLFDMLGNADEWLHSPQTGNAPPPGPLYDPGGSISQNAFKMRSGGTATGWPTVLRAANRLSYDWRLRAPLIGFRLARSVARTNDGGAGIPDAVTGRHL